MIACALVFLLPVGVLFGVTEEPGDISAVAVPQRPHLAGEWVCCLEMCDTYMETEKLISCLWIFSPHSLSFQLNESTTQHSIDMARPQSRLEKQPERKHPFVPELYGGLVRGSFQNILFPHVVRTSTLARLRGKFVPEIELKKNIESTSDEDLARLHNRAKLLTEHAAENTVYEVSESTWESDIRTDLFGGIREDRQLRM